MILDIKSSGFDLTAALEAHVVNRIGHSLGPCAYRAPRVTVRMQDINGPKGGVDKECRIVVSLPGKAPIVATVRDEDMYVAIARAARSAGRAAYRSRSRFSARVHPRSVAT